MKQQQFILTVTVPIEDNFDTVIKLLKFTEYEKTYLPSTSTVHIMVYKFGPLTELGVENFKNAFREIFKKSPFRDLCTFTTSEITI